MRVARTVLKKGITTPIHQLSIAASSPSRPPSSTAASWALLTLAAVTLEPAEELLPPSSFWLFSICCVAPYLSFLSFVFVNPQFPNSPAIASLCSVRTGLCNGFNGQVDGSALASRISTSWPLSQQPRDRACVLLQAGHLLLKLLPHLRCTGVDSRHERPHDYSISECYGFILTDHTPTLRPNKRLLRPARF